MDWQTPAAIGVVVITAMIFAIRFIRQRLRKKSGGCGGGCSCPMANKLGAKK